MILGKTYVVLTCTVDSHRTLFVPHQPTLFVVWCRSCPHDHSLSIFCQPTFKIEWRWCRDWYDLTNISWLQLYISCLTATDVPYHGSYWLLRIFWCCCLFFCNIKNLSGVHFYSFEIWNQWSKHRLIYTVNIYTVKKFKLTSKWRKMVWLLEESAFMQSYTQAVTILGIYPALLTHGRLVFHWTNSPHSTNNGSHIYSVLESREAKLQYRSEPNEPKTR